MWPSNPQSNAIPSMVENVDFFRVNFVFRASTIRKRGTKCRKKKYPKISPKIGEKSTRIENPPPVVKKIDDILVCFVDFSPIFCQLFEKIGAPHLLLILWLPTSLHWFDGPNLVWVPTVNFICIWWSKLKLDVIQRSELNPNGHISPRFRFNGQFCFATIKWNSNNYFDLTFFYK